MNWPTVPQAVLDREAGSPGTRLCYRCDELKPCEKFYGGHHRECMDCRSIRALSRTDVERWRDMVSASRVRARRRGWNHTITVEDLDIPTHCPVFGFRLRWGTRFQRDHSPSIDRIDPEKGYVPGNIIIVSWLANNIRGKFTSDQLRKVADFYEVLSSTR